jgi:threonylcarbamoyladenosine tRNA methylthiotransferase MtaB
MVRELTGRNVGAESISSFEGHTRAFLKVQDGCDNYCSYCIVPSLRGTPRSRSLDAIEEEAEKLARSGFKEVVLTGIHLGKYGIDLVPRVHLCQVIERLAGVTGIKRIRLSSIHAQEFDADLIRTIRNTRKLCPHFHIPLQSGDEEVLRRMKRRYTPGQFLQIIEALRGAIDNPSFTTDVLVGFPGETRAAFQNTVELCKKVNFSRTHVFPFSRRPGTPAASMGRQVPENEKRRRKEMLLQLADEMALTYKRQFLSKTVKALVLGEKRHTEGLVEGLTARYMFTLFEGGLVSPGQFANVKITDVTPGYLKGALC